MRGSIVCQSLISLNRVLIPKDYLVPSVYIGFLKGKDEHIFTIIIFSESLLVVGLVLNLHRDATGTCPGCDPVNTEHTYSKKTWAEL